MPEERKAKQQINEAKLLEEIKPQINEAKLLEVQEIIERAAELIEDKDCDTDEYAKKELSELQKRLRILTGKKQFDIRNVYGYWAYTDLETRAAQLLMQEPQRCGLSDEALQALIQYIFDSGALEKEAEHHYWYDFLELETGIDGVMNFLLDFNEKGELIYAPIDTVMERIRESRK